MPAGNGDLRRMAHVRFRAIVFVMLTPGLAGCDHQGALPWTGPTPTELPLSVTAVHPRSGIIGSTVRIWGTGFSPGTTVTLGGSATNVRVVDGTFITATTPVLAGGTVDVVVTNASGHRVILAAGYTIEVVTLTASATVVAPGGQLSVTLVAPGRQSTDPDWVGLFKVGEPSTPSASVWSSSVEGASELTGIAPTQPGQYEFRYVVGDSLIEAARSAPVTVR